MKTGVKLLTVLSFFVSILLLTSLLPKSANATPIFSRKYQTSCMTCHAVFPRLTAVGQAFRLNGFKMPGGDELYVKDKPVSMGADAYKRMFPNAVWPSDIPNMPPISLRVVTDLQIDIGSDSEDARDSNWKMEAPHEIELLSMGSFGDNMSFHAEVEWEHPDDLEHAFKGWLMWEDIFAENIVNLKVGSLGGRETGLPNMAEDDRIGSDHLMARDEVTKHLSGPGIEVNGFGKIWRYAAGVMKPNQDSYSGDEGYYVQGSLKFGGVGYDGSGGASEEGGLKTSPAGYWRDDSLLVGGFYFDDPDNVDADDSDHIQRYGFDARLNFKDLSLLVAWARKANDDTDNVDKDVYTAEATYFVLPWLQPFARWEMLDADEADKDETKISVGAAMLARANVKVILEAQFFTENEPEEAKGNDKDNADRIYARLDFIF